MRFIKYFDIHTIFFILDVFYLQAKESKAPVDKGFNFDDPRIMKGAWRNEPNSDACKVRLYNFKKCTLIMYLPSSYVLLMLLSSGCNH